MQDWIESIRPKHWIKSFFCLAALIFSGNWILVDSWIQVSAVLIGFSLLSSGAYLINDVVNIKEDNCHPRKCHRPLASGRLERNHVLCVALSLVVFGVGLMFWKYGKTGNLIRWTPVVACIYFIVTTLYTFHFRKYAVLDVLVIGFGFLLRVIAGSFALNLFPTFWLLSCSYFMVLVIGFGKRHGELTTMSYEEASEGEIGNTRQALMGYTSGMLIKLISACAVMAGLLYLAYCLSRTDRLPFLITVIPVITGLITYLNQLKQPDSERVERPESLLFREPLLLGSVVAWIILILASSKL